MKVTISYLALSVVPIHGLKPVLLELLPERFSEVASKWLDYIPGEVQSVVFHSLDLINYIRTGKATEDEFALKPVIVKNKSDIKKCKRFYQEFRLDEKKEFMSIIDDNDILDVYVADFPMARWYNSNEGRNWNCYHAGVAFLSRKTGAHYVFDFSPLHVENARLFLAPAILRTPPIIPYLLGYPVLKFQWYNQGYVRVLRGSEWPKKEKFSILPRLTLDPQKLDKIDNIPCKKYFDLIPHFRTWGYKVNCAFGYKTFLKAGVISGKDFIAYANYVDQAYNLPTSFSIVNIISPSGEVLIGSANCHDFLQNSLHFLTIERNMIPQKKTNFLRDAIFLEAKAVYRLGTYEELSRSDRRHLHRLLMYYKLHEDKLMFSFASLVYCFRRLSNFGWPLLIFHENVWWKIITPTEIDVQYATSLGPLTAYKESYERHITSSVIGLLNYCYYVINPKKHISRPALTKDLLCAVPWKDGKYAQVDKKATDTKLCKLGTIGPLELLLLISYKIETDRKVQVILSFILSFIISKIAKRIFKRFTPPITINKSTIPKE